MILPFALRIILPTGVGPNASIRSLVSDIVTAAESKRQLPIKTSIEAIDDFRNFTITILRTWREQENTSRSVSVYMFRFRKIIKRSLKARYNPSQQRIFRLAEATDYALFAATIAGCGEPN